MPEVVCIGILVADVIARPLTAYPERGKLVLVDSMELHTGGCAANTAVALAKLGVPTSVIGKVGQDTFGRFVVDRLRAQGIETAGIKQGAVGKTSATMVMVDENNERSFVHYAGANTELALADIDSARVQAHRLLHLGGMLLMPNLDGAPAAELLRRAKADGLTTSVDTVWDPTGRWLEAVGPCLPYTDYFLPSYEEARMLSGLDRPEAIADFFLARGVRVVGLKMGARGSLVQQAGQPAIPLPAYAVPVVDTTGAGDGFVAGFLAGVLRGWDLVRTGRFANAVGACCVSAVGATEGLKDFAQAERIVAGTGPAAG